MKMEKYGFQVSFKVLTDIEDKGQTIHMGWYGIGIDEEDFEYLRKKNPEIYCKIDEMVIRDYHMEQERFRFKPESLEDKLAIEAAKNRDPGCIYFLKVTGQDLFKIGLSRSDVDARIRGLQTACPYPIKVHSKLESLQCRKDEGWFHEYFKEYKSSGEWFKVSPEMIDTAKTEIDIFHKE